MTIIQVVILAIIQGLTEFLPVSSSGHLVLTSAIYQIIQHDFVFGGEEEVFTDIILHVGTLLAVVVFFRKDIISICKAFFTAVKTKDFSSFEAKLPIYLVIGTFFTVIIAFPLHEHCEDLVASPKIIGFLLLITGAILFFSENISSKIEKTEQNKNITLKQAILMGLAQGFAAIPGISRSGATIATGMLSGLDRVTAARYSFLLSIFIIMGASIFYPILKLDADELTMINWNAVVIGFFTSVFVGYMCVKYFMQFIGKYSMKCFAYYCWFIGFCAIIYFNFVM